MRRLSFTSRRMTSVLLVCGTLITGTLLALAGRTTWDIVLLAVGVTLISIAGRAFRGRRTAANGWDWDLMTARYTRGGLPSVHWQPHAVFIDALDQRFWDTPAFALDTTIAGTQTDALARIADFRSVARTWTEHTPTRIEAVFDAPPINGLSFADTGSRMFINIEQHPQGTRIRAVVFSGGFGIANPLSAGSIALTDATVDALSSSPILDEVGAFLVGTITETERAYRGPASWWIALAGRFDLAADAAQQVDGLKLVKVIAKGQVRSISTKRTASVIGSVVAVIVAVVVVTTILLEKTEPQQVVDPPTPAFVNNAAERYAAAIDQRAAELQLPAADLTTEQYADTVDQLRKVFEDVTISDGQTRIVTPNYTVTVVFATELDGSSRVVPG